MNPIIIFKDKSINIKYIDNEDSHYQLNIPNNDINKKLIENTVFKFEKSGTQTIIMHDDNNVFQLNKIECKYSEFIEIKEQLENTEKEVNLIKNELTDIKDLLYKQIKIYDKNEEHTPIIFNRNYDNPIKLYGYDGELVIAQFDNTSYNIKLKVINYLNSKLIDNRELVEKIIKSIKNTTIINFTSDQIIIPPKKILIIGLWDNPVKIYTSGYHYNIHPGRVWWFGCEEYKDDIIKVFSKINTLTSDDDYYYDINIKTFEDTWKILTNEINENQIIIQKLELENDEIIKYETMELLVNRVNRNIQDNNRGIGSKIDEYEKKFYFFDSCKNSKGNPVFYDVNDINISEYKYRDPNNSNSPNNLKMRNGRIIGYYSKKNETLNFEKDTLIKEIDNYLLQYTWIK